jgi:hypothetical protein
MTLFQWIALSVLGALLLWELIRLWLGPVARGAWFVRFIVWLAAGVAIYEPGFVQIVAGAIGIGRGADVVLYLFVLAFLATSFYFYARSVRVQRQITQLVRHLAIQEARRGGRDTANA